METKDSLKALEKGLVVLETIKEAEQPIGVNEISRQCDMNPPTVFRILQMLKRRNWVYQDRNDKYIVGHRISFVTSPAPIKSWITFPPLVLTFRSTRAPVVRY